MVACNVVENARSKISRMSAKIEHHIQHLNLNITEEHNYRVIKQLADLTSVDIFPIYAWVGFGA